MPAPPSPPVRWSLTVLAALPALLLAAAQCAWAWPFFSDDSFISLRFAQRLLEGQGLTWTDGEAVEGYSNLLWVLATAGLGALGIELVAAARLLGGACTALSLVLLARAGGPVDRRSALGASVAPLLVAAAAPGMGWTLGGLEGPMVLLWLVWGGREILALGRGDGRTRDDLRAGLPFALLCLTRPDGPLWAAAAGLALLAPGWRQGPVPAIARALRFLTLPATAVLGQSGFRIAYHGDFVPNTAHVKLGLGDGVAADGARYVLESLQVTPGLAGPALLALAWLAAVQPGRFAALALGVPALLYATYLVAIGGDHFPGYRLWQPMLAPLGLLVATAGQRFATVWLRRLALLALGLGGAAANTWLARTDPLSALVRHETFEWTGKAIGEVFARSFGPARPLLAVDAAGALPYYSRLPALDMLGLCDRTIATTPTPAWAGPAAVAGGLVRRQGHLRGNGAHVMDQAPDLVLFGPPPGLPLPVFLSGMELEYDRRFLDGYRWVTMELPPGDRPGAAAGPITSCFWVRVEGRAGVQTGPERITVPAWLLGAFRQRIPIMCRMERKVGTPEAEARAAAEAEAIRWFGGERHVAAVPSAEGPLLLELHRPAPARLDLAVPEGTWRLAADPPTAGLGLALEGATADGEHFTVAPGGAATAVVATPAAGAVLPLRLRAVTLHRVR